VAFRLRYQAHDLEIPDGEFVIGRSPECQLALDDARVSRKHAVLRATTQGVLVEDLGSRNGVTVNGHKIDGQRLCIDGDRVTIGSQEMLIYKGGSGQHQRTLTVQGSTHTLAEIPVEAVRQAREAAEADKRSSSPSINEMPRDNLVQPQRSHSNVRVLGAVADKALALGRVDEAERILGSVLLDLMGAVRGGRPIDDDVFDASVKAALKLASAGAKGAWVEYVFDMHHELNRLLAAPIVDELYTVVRKVKAVDKKPLRRYLELLERRQLTAAEKFLYQRIQGLENLVALK
jgi:hypothetical protein